MRLTCIDAFCGAGGLSLGLSRAGFEVVYSFDIDPESIDTIKSNNAYFKHKAEVLDINNLDPKKIMSEFALEKGDLTLFAGGPPCQGFSIQRIGDDYDPRNELISVFIDKMIQFNPKFFLIENVPGITGRRGRENLNMALEIASKNGYFIHSQFLDAQYYGVPQRRKRLFVIGERSQDRQRFQFPQQHEIYTSVRDTIYNLPKPPDDGTDHPNYPHHRKDRLSKLNLDRIRAVQEGQGMSYLPKRLLAKCHELGPERIGHRNVYGRMSWDKVSPTITARFDSFTRGLFGHPEQDRSITLREGALLQTFPMDFIFSGNKVDIARQIGNAVPPQLAYEIGLKIIEASQ